MSRAPDRGLREPRSTATQRFPQAPSERSTVLGLMNSCAAISRLVCPCAARRETCASCGVSWSSVWTVRLRARSPVACNSTRARSANASMPEVGEEVVGDPQLLARVERGGVRVAATRRRAGARGRGRRGGASARDGRSPPGRASPHRPREPTTPATALRRRAPTACRSRRVDVLRADLERLCGAVVPTAAAGGLDQLDHRPVREPQLVRILGRLLGRAAKASS